MEQQAYAVILVGLAAVYSASLLRRLRGNYILSIFQFLFAYCTLYGFGLYGGATAIREFHGGDVLPLCWVVALLGFAGVVVGYRVFPLQKVRRWAHLRRQPNLGRLAFMGAIFISLGIAGELYFIHVSGGEDIYFSEARGKGAYDATSAYIAGARWLWPVGIAFLAAAGSYRKSARLGAIGGLVLLGAYNIILGQRTGVYVTALSAVYCSFVWRNRLPSISKVVGAVLISAVLMGFLAITRDDFHTGSDFEHVRALMDRPLGDILQDTILANVQTDKTYTANTEIVLYAGYLQVLPGQVNFDYFKYYTGFIYAWIPRLLWPSRPDPAAEKVSELVAVLGTSHRSGPTPTMLGMYYLHLGVLSVFFMCVLTGLYLAFIDAHGRLASVNPVAATVFISLGTQGLAMPMGLGPLASLPTLLPFTAVPLGFGLWWACRSPRRVAPGMRAEAARDGRRQFVTRTRFSAESQSSVSTRPAHRATSLRETKYQWP